MAQGIIGIQLARSGVAVRLDLFRLLAFDIGAQGTNGALRYVTMTLLDSSWSDATYENDSLRALVSLLPAAPVLRWSLGTHFGAWPLRPVGPRGESTYQTTIPLLNAAAAPTLHLALDLTSLSSTIVPVYVTATYPWADEGLTNPSLYPSRMLLSDRFLAEMLLLFHSRDDGGSPLVIVQSVPMGSGPGTERLTLPGFFVQRGSFWDAVLRAAVDCVEASDFLSDSPELPPAGSAVDATPTLRFAPRPPYPIDAANSLESGAPYSALTLSGGGLSDVPPATHVFDVALRAIRRPILTYPPIASPDIFRTVDPTLYPALDTAAAVGDTVPHAPDPISLNFYPIASTTIPGGVSAFGVRAAEPLAEAARFHSRFYISAIPAIRSPAAALLLQFVI